MRALGRIWLAGGALIAVIVVAFGWFILAMPQLDQAAEADVQQASVQAQNDQLQAVLTTMKAQYENLDALKEQLEELQLSVPGTRSLDAYFFDLAVAANLAGVVLAGVDVGVAAPYAGAASAPVVPSSVLQPNLFLLPVTIKITADLAESTAFLESLQSNNGRLTLLNGVKLTLGSSLNGEITGFIFVVHDPTKGPIAALPTATPSPDPEDTPEPSTEPEPSSEPEPSTEPESSETPVPAT